MRIEIIEISDNDLLEEIDIIFPEIESRDLFLQMTIRKKDNVERRGVNLVFDNVAELLNFIVQFHVWIAKMGKKGLQEVMDLAIEKAFGKQ